MEKSLSHLPKIKRDELKLVVRTICEIVPDTEKIILFGSYARGNWVDGLHYQSDGLMVIKKKSDYDILVVTAGKASAKDITLWDKVDKACLELSLSTYARIISIDIKDINRLLEIGQYFYTDIKKQGIPLYDTGEYKLADQRLLRPKELKRIAKEHYRQWFKSAREFFYNYEINVEKRRYKNAAFQLNQATEHAYKGILLVFTNYCPNEHYLSTLSEIAAKKHKALANIFPQDTPRQRRLFKLLDYAYIGARYDPDYRIAKEQLETLAECARNLLVQMEKLCPAEISAIGRCKRPAGEDVRAQLRRARKRKTELKSKKRKQQSIRKHRKK